MGGSSGVTFDELLALADQVLSQGCCSRPDAIATLSTKCGELAWNELAAHYECALCFFDAERLEKETPRLENPSETVLEAVGCHGVAEAAALAATGPNGFLVVEKPYQAGQLPHWLSPGPDFGLCGNSLTSLNNVGHERSDRKQSCGRCDDGNISTLKSRRCQCRQSLCICWR
ncbi:cobalamin biosynthesis protein [Ochrobactrum anthropi]|nr:cobalamin biosynthesis protein [Brucella anthropi]